MKPNPRTFDDYTVIRKIQAGERTTQPTSWWIGLPREQFSAEVERRSVTWKATQMPSGYAPQAIGRPARTVKLGE